MSRAFDKSNVLVRTRSRSLRDVEQTLLADLADAKDAFMLDDVLGCVV